VLERYLLCKSRNTAEIGGNWGSTCRQGVFVHMRVAGEGQHHGAFQTVHKREAMKGSEILASWRAWREFGENFSFFMQS